MNGEGERPLCDALTSLFYCELPEGPWPFCGTETWDPSGKNCRCSGNSRTVIPQPAPAGAYDTPHSSGNQPKVQEFQPPSVGTVPAMPGPVPMPSDVPEIPEGVLPEIVPGEAESGKIVEPPLWFRIREQSPAPSIEPAPDAPGEPASEPSAETSSEPAAEPGANAEPAAVPEPAPATEPMPVPPASEDPGAPEVSEVPEVPAEPTTERPELPPLPASESQPAAETPVPSPPPAPAPRLRQTRVPRGFQRRE